MDTESPGWRRSHPLVFVDDLSAPMLDEGDFRHLTRSLRLEIGADITIADGAGRWCAARLALRPEPAGDVVVTGPQEFPIVVAFTPVKGQKVEWILQKLTEIGVQRMVPLIADRSVVRWDGERRDKLTERWPRVVREAAMQSRQVHLPIVDSPTSVADHLSQWPEAVLADPDGEPIGHGTRHLLIGPEGGWSNKERQLARAVSLPGGVLRAETACVVGAAMLAALREGYRKTSHRSHSVVDAALGDV
jgi:16S rRNA (uracil1498-N3)-methyltransferase